MDTCDLTPPISEPEANASIVIEYDEIAKDKEAQFRAWQSELKAGVSQFKGYQGTDICSPIPGLQNKWYVVVRFDTPASLGEWLDSDIRHDLVGRGKRQFGSYRYKIGTGLEGWFVKGRNALAQMGPPAWKQNFAVLFGLYPTVMLETIVFSHFGVLETWPLAPKMFVNNLVSCSLLTWIVMPLTTRLLNFWLKPAAEGVGAGRSPQAGFFSPTNLIGTGLIFMAYGLMIAIFNRVTQ